MVVLILPSTAAVLWSSMASSNSFISSFRGIQYDVALTIGNGRMSYAIQRYRSLNTISGKSGLPFSLLYPQSLKALDEMAPLG